MALGQEVREGCAAIARDARSVRIDLDALDALDPGPPPELDPRAPLSEGPAAGRRGLLPSRSTRSTSARAGSRRCKQAPGLLGLLHGRVGAGRPLPRRRGRGRTPSCARCAPSEVADIARPAAPTTSSWRSTPRRCASSGASSATATPLDLVAAAGGSAAALRRDAGRRHGDVDDRGFYKRAQIAASDLALGGRRALRRPRRADDLRRQPRPPRAALRRRARLRRRRSPRAIDVGQLLPHRPRRARDPRLRRARLRAARARALGMPPRELDTRLWIPRPGARSTRPARGTAAGRSSTSARGVMPAAWIRPPARASRPTRGRRARAASRRRGSAAHRPQAARRPPRRSALVARARRRRSSGRWLARPRSRRRPGRAGGSSRRPGPSARRPSTRTTWPGLPTTVAFGGTSVMTTRVRADLRAQCPTVIGPSSFAPEPT